MKCPECEQGKVDNCTGWVINEDDEVDVCETLAEPEDPPATKDDDPMWGRL